MTLTEAIAANQTCREPGCKRTPAYPGQAFCADHRLRWEPEWVKRAREHRLVAKELT